MRTVDISLDSGVPAQILVSRATGATVLTSVVELAGRLAGRLPSAMRTAASARLRQVDLTPLIPLRSPGPLPEGLFPTVGSAGSFGEELDQIGANAELVVEQIHARHPHDPPAFYHDWIRRPQAAMGRYLTALRRYHELVVQELYPDLLDRLAREADVYRRAIDGEGVSVLHTLHPKVSGYAGGLRYVEPAKSGQLRVAPTRVILTPMVAAPQTVVANLHGVIDADNLWFCFASPNLAIVDVGPRVGGRPADPLGTLIGATRARVVRALAIGASTKDLANKLKLSPPTVSHHLRVLTESDTATAYRSGASVYYRLTDRGQMLLRQYGDLP